VKIPQVQSGDVAIPAAKWLKFINAAGIEIPGLAEAKSERARSILLGKWLGVNVNRLIPVTHNGQEGNAYIRVIAMRSREKRYYVEWLPAQTADEIAASSKTKRKSDHPQKMNTKRQL
jgi:hypothetical protein